MPGTRYRGRAAAAAAMFATALGVAGPASASAPDGVGYCTPPRAAGHAPSAGAGHALPAAAVGPVSRILGRDEPGYLVARAGGELVAHSRPQHLTALFGRTGVTVRSGQVTVGMRPAGYGYGGQLRPVRLAAPVAHANRVTYSGGPLTQWYANGPAGLEQGFTITTRPAGAPHGPLTVALAVSGGAKATVTGGGLTFRGAGPALAYRNLTVTDATGRRLHAWLTLSPGRALLHTSAAGARYPVTIDPVFEQLAKLTTDDGASTDNDGYSVAVSGATVAVGAPSAQGTAGAVYVFTEPASGWTDATQTAKLTADNGSSGDNLGWSVALDGATIVAGALNSDSEHGAAYVFTEPGGGWTNGTQTAELTPNADSTHLGTSVAIDGNTIVAGAPNTNTQRGAVFVFTKPVGGWTDENQAAVLTASDGAVSDHLGSSAGVSGNTVVAGAPGSGSEQGAVYVYTEPGGGWADGTQTAKLTASDGSAGDNLGASVGISQNTIVAGAPGAASEGTVYVYTEPGGGWADGTQTAKLTASDAGYDFQVGSAVAIDGNTVVAGAPGAGPDCSDNYGAAYVFTEPAGGWSDETETAKLTASDGSPGDDLGFSVGISGDTVAAGAPFAEIGENSAQGAAYVFGSPFVPPPPGALKLAGFLSPHPKSHVRAGSAVVVRTRVDYADGTAIPGWLAGELASGCELTLRVSGTQHTRARCLRWNPAKHWFYLAWKTHRKPTGTSTLTIDLYYHTHTSRTEKLILTAPRHRRR